MTEPPKPYQVESAAVAVGSVVVIPGDSRKNITSKIAQVIGNNIMGDKCELTVIDREGGTQKLNTKLVDV